MRVREARGEAGRTAVFFVHAAGLAGWAWRPLLDALGALDRAGRWRLVALDLPDHGSDLDAPFPDIPTVADELATLVEASSPGGRAYLVGHELGAKIVLEVLARRQGVVLGAVLASALVRSSPLLSLGDSRLLGEMGRMTRSRVMAAMRARSLSFPDPSMERSYVAEALTMDRGNLERPLAAFAARLFPPPGLERVSCPVLVTVGGKEAPPLRGSAEDLAALIPGARLEVVEDARHTYPWARAADFATLLLSFLSSSVRPGRR